MITTIFLCLMFTSCGKKKKSDSFEAMSTYCSVQIYGGSTKNISQAKAKIFEIENLVSTTKTDSEIFRINSNPEAKNKVNELTYRLVDYSKRMAYETEGALNPALYPVTSAWGFTTQKYTVPSQEKIDELKNCIDFTKIQLTETASDSGKDYFIQLDKNMKLDLGAVGKGFAGDEVLKLLSQKGIKSALIDFGGNVQALGTKPDGSAWRVGIRSSWSDSPVAVLEIKNQAVITSGGSERFFEADDGKRYIHIFDADTCRPVENNIASLTIVCDSGAYGDSLSTAMFVMGTEKAIKYQQARKDFEMIIITEDREIFYTAGLENKIRLLEQFSETQIIR